MEHCKVDGCTETPEHCFALAMRPDTEDEDAQMASAEGKICSSHATALWSLLGPPPMRATQAMTEELSKEINDGADAEVIRMPKRLAGL